MKRIKYALAAVFLVSTFSQPALASLIGDEVTAAITNGTQFSGAVITQFSNGGPTVVTDPGVEFTGATWNTGFTTTTFGIEVDVSADTFAVTLTNLTGGSGFISFSGLDLSCLSE